MTRTISIWPSALVMPVTSDSAAGAVDRRDDLPGAASFFRVVTSPDSDLTLISSILSASSAANTFSCVEAGVVGRLPGDEVDVGTEADQDDEQRDG